ncbi:hypothetical protein INT45_002970 [Circinella minor]|uniref:Uncharacterized protein n=1 Tax=Circinella minor TaxID=1195481 RepID=A0A8H7SA72_9FUNG|nr:hypothetical protein INT45_002970 [Circinella minor]
MNDRTLWNTSSICNNVTIWENCVKTILGLLEDSFEIQNKVSSSSLYNKRIGKQYHSKTNSILRSGIQQQQQQQQQRSLNNDHGSAITTISKRKRSNFSDNLRDRKMQRISNNLANDIARHLSMADHENNRPHIIGISDDVDMDTTNNNNNNNINKPIPPRVYKRPIRKTNLTQTTNHVLGHRFSNNNNNNNITTTCTFNDQQQEAHCILKRIFTSHLNQPMQNTKMEHDFDVWLKQQAQRQNINILEYQHVFNEKQNQLQHCLQEMNTTDYTKSNDERFQTIKENLEHILKIVHELSGDHTLPFTDIFPEWRVFEVHIQKLASYVQSIEDMKELVSQAIPRTNDLLSDIQSLQSILESKMTLYGDNLIQNGLGWKAMGLPVDEQLIATVKGWFYNLCIGLISELDTECSKLQSLVTDMRELLHHPEGDKLMESIQNGVEFIASVISFIGLPSRKLIYGCRILVTIYGQWVSENLEYLREQQQQQHNNSNNNKHGSATTTTTTTNNNKNITTMDIKMMNSRSTFGTTARVDIRLMQWMDGIVQILTSLQTLQEVSASTTLSLNNNNNNNWVIEQEEQEETKNVSSLQEQQSFDTESYNVLENLTSTLVDITIRAISVIETTRRNNNINSTRPGNIMMNSETSLIYMQRSVLAFVDRVVELSGREHIDDSRIQRLHRHLEQNEEDLQL